MNYQNLFNQDHYPTPEDVTARMLSLTKISGKIVLEPSAGSGSIVSFLKRQHAKEVIACEINDDLRASLERKCRVIASDFLKVQSSDISHVDVIVMNPPFSHACEHIQHAWDIAPDGCEIVSLCNSETLRNAYSTERRALKSIIAANGGTEDIGNAFAKADRRTDVSVSIVRLFKPKSGADEFDGYFDMSEEEQVQSGEGIVTYDFVRDCVNRYVAAVSKFDTAMSMNNGINALTREIGGDAIKFGAFYVDANRNQHAITDRNEFKKELQKRAWKWLFSKFNMQKYMTRSVMDDVNKFVETQTQIPFTMRNIYLMVEMIVGTHGSRVQRVIEEAVDTICSYSPENSGAGESWRTNSDYMINRRFIVPYICEQDAFHKGCESVYLTWGAGSVERIEDIQRALCFLTGRSYDEMTSLRSFVSSNNCLYGVKYDWGFFRVKFFKKGTMHLEFIDEDTWYRFNQSVAQARGWHLPQQTTKRTHKNNWK